MRRPRWRRTGHQRSPIRVVVLGLSVAALACATQGPHYVGVVHQGLIQSDVPPPLTVNVFNLEYSSQPTLKKGWYQATPISVMFENHTDAPILIDWDRSALVDSNGETLSIIHKGVSIADAKSGNYQSYQRQSVVAPHAKLSDLVVPTQWIQWIAREWMICLKPTPADNYVLSITFVLDGKAITSPTPFAVSAPVADASSAVGK